MLIVGIELGDIMGISKKDLNLIFDKSYPIGSYYFSNVDKSPGQLFNIGEWIRIQDVFVKAANSSIDSTGGNQSVTIPSFVPSHSHNFSDSHTHSVPTHTHLITGTHSHPVASHNHTGTVSHSHSHKHPDNPEGKQAGGGQYWEYVAKTPLTTVQVQLTGKASSSSTSSTASSYSTASSTIDSFSTKTASIGTDYEDSNSSGNSSSYNCNIMPPYRTCYCWKRVA